jgi:hypothetical protein
MGCLPEELGLRAPPAPLHHVAWVLAAGAVAGGLASTFLSFQLQLKIETARTTGCFVRQCVCGGWGCADLETPFLGMQYLSPSFPHMCPQPSQTAIAVGHDPGTQHIVIKT